MDILNIFVNSAFIAILIFWGFDLVMLNYTRHKTAKLNAKANDLYSQLRLLALEPNPEPTLEPTLEPNLEPTLEPNPEPTLEPNLEPTLEPNLEPTLEPNLEPTLEPNLEPTLEPNLEPTLEPNLEPTLEPNLEPTLEPNLEPTLEPNPDYDYYVTQFSIRELKKLASVAKITGYSKMTKHRLAMELAKQDI